MSLTGWLSMRLVRQARAREARRAAWSAREHERRCQREHGDACEGVHEEEAP